MSLVFVLACSPSLMLIVLQGRLKPRGTFVNRFAHVPPDGTFPMRVPTVQFVELMTPRQRVELEQRARIAELHQRGNASPGQSAEPPESWWNLLFEYLPVDSVIEHCKML